MTKKKAARTQKEKVVNVRLTAQQKTTLDEIADGQGMGLSTWLLHLGLADAQERQEKARR